MPVETEYLGMPLRIEDFDGGNLAYFQHCADGNFSLQHCSDCDLVRYPPTTACPWCASPECTWKAIEGKGTVHSYTEVCHAIQPAFRDHTPYLVLLVELDTQQGRPSEHESLRIIGNLVTAEGQLAPPEVVETVGIGSRVRIVYSQVDDALAIPNWTLDEDADQPEILWRYPD